jgi:hypothetical protein
LLSTAGTSAIDAIGSNQSYRSFFCHKTRFEFNGLRC